MRAILGLSAFYHDSAAALLLDGRIIAAAQEERFTRIKHDPAFPTQAAAYCLSEAGLTANQVDFVAFYEKPLAKFDRLLETYLARAPRGWRSFSRALPVWLKDKLHLPSRIRAALGGYTGPLAFTEHHESHAASAFFSSPFDQAAILTVDGVGEWATSTQGTGSGGRFQLTRQLQFPHSVGLLYSAFTYYCGFKVNSGEYKLMGLAPYGRPIFADRIRNHLLDLKQDGSFRLNLDFFDFLSGLAMTNRAFHALFGGQPRAPEGPILQRHMDLAASIQAVTEEIVLRMACELHATTGMANLVLAGGVALNCVANGKIMREAPFKNVWIPPAAGDAGGALGAAQFVWHQLLEKPRRASPVDSLQGGFLGPQYRADEIERYLADRRTSCRRMESSWELCETVASLLVEEKIVGWFQGRMEFGPRALGARSILADPRPADMQSRLNMQIKFREGFRPFAPAVLAERAAEWFDLEPGVESPYMLLTAPVRRHLRLDLSQSDEEILAGDPDLCKRVNIARSRIPAVTHVDWSARLQTVDEERNPLFHQLLLAFERQTGCPILANTSFNVRGEPIVCAPEDAIRCFEATGIDVLVLENLILEKTASASQPAASIAHRMQFPLD